jgi:hypothetical protein
MAAAKCCFLCSVSFWEGTGKEEIYKYLKTTTRWFTTPFTIDVTAIDPR